MIDLSSHGVGALIIKRKRFLLIQEARQPLAGSWRIPGGVCEPGDNSEEVSVKREIMEKLGLEVKPNKKIWTAKADIRAKTVSFWLVTNVKGKVKLDSKVSSNFNWFTPEQALKLKLYPATRDFFTLLQKKQILE